MEGIEQKIGLPVIWEEIYEFFEIGGFLRQTAGEESRELFSLKLDMLLGKRGYADFMDTLLELDYSWNMTDRFSKYDDFRYNIKGRKGVIFGAGIDGKMTYDILQKNGIPIYAFCDNDIRKHGTDICGCKVIDPSIVRSNSEEFYVVIASYMHAGDIFRGLTTNFFPRENIWHPRLGTLYATTGWQYFDCPGLEPLGEEEVFIDAGCFNADTSRDFVKL